LQNLKNQSEEEKKEEGLHGRRDYDRLELENNKPQTNKEVYLKGKKQN
jgi:hypothetical protein